MNWQHTIRSKKDYDDAPEAVQKAFDKQVRFLADNLLHPSLHAKKYKVAGEDLWQARVSKRLAFLFQDRRRHLHHHQNHPPPQRLTASPHAP